MLFWCYGTIKNPSIDCIQDSLGKTKMHMSTHFLIQSNFVISNQMVLRDIQVLEIQRVKHTNKKISGWDIQKTCHCIRDISVQGIKVQLYYGVKKDITSSITEKNQIQLNEIFFKLYATFTLGQQKSILLNKQTTAYFLRFINSLMIKYVKNKSGL